MVQITQTEEEIKIIIELNRLITRKPDVVVLPFYIKFNNPPIFFERHLKQEIDETASFCRIFKNEARIVLIKKQKGIWPDIFEKFSKEELLKKRLEIAEQIVERNKIRDQQAMERFECKRRNEINKEIKRETAMRDRVKQFEENARREALMVGVRKETHPHPNFKSEGNASHQNYSITPNSGCSRLGTPITVAPRAPMIAVRSGGKINVNFSKFDFTTPKRESQQDKPRPFIIEDHPHTTQDKSKLETLKE